MQAVVKAKRKKALFLIFKNGKIKVKLENQNVLYYIVINLIY